MKKFLVDGYEVTSDSLKSVIEKIAEGDGSTDFSSMISYLAEASSLLIHAIHEMSEEHYIEKTERLFEK